MADQQLKIGLYDTVFVVNSFTTFAPGTYLFRVNTVGNSILSTVYVHTGPGVATVRWFDFGAGREITDPGAQFTLHTHTTLGAAASERSIVTKIHNHVFCEVVVSGGSVEMGVLATLISQFPVDLIGLQADATPADLLLDGGLPVGVYDPADGNWYVLRGSGGVLSTGSALATPVMELATIAAANTEQSHTFPVGTRRFMMKARGPSKIKLSHASAGAYMTIWPGAFYTSPEFAPDAKVIYFQSPLAGLEIELESWS